MARSSKKSMPASKAKAAPKKLLMPDPAPRKKAPHQKTLTAEGWKRLMLKSSSKSKKVK